MSKKDNLNQAMYEMFGVGKTPVEKTTEPIQSKPEEKKQPKIEPMPVATPVVKHTEVTYFAAGTVMEGTIKTKGDVEIHGDFKGDLTSEGRVSIYSAIEGNIAAKDLRVIGCRLQGDVNISGTLEIDGASAIEGNVHAGATVCSGKVKGDLDIKGNLSLEESARIEGNIKTYTMDISRGAKIFGNIEMPEVSK